MSKRTKLTKEEFFKWRSSIYEMHEAKHLQKLAELELKLMRKDIELADVKSHLFAKNKLDGAVSRTEKSLVEYNKIKEELEKKLGYSLSDVVIDEITHEVKDLKELKK